MLTPKKLKYRKPFNPNPTGTASRKIELAFGSFGLKSLENAWISERQIESARRAMTRSIKRGGKIWTRIFPHNPITGKGGEVRMGGGKGAIQRYVSSVRSGTIMFEMDGVTEDIAREAFRLASHKLPVKTKIVVKEGQ